MHFKMLWLYLEAYEPLFLSFVKVVKMLVSFLAAHRPGSFYHFSPPARPA